jgi:2-dehydropantoate 2-reductase
MRICFVGAGALGCSLGGILTEGGSDVYLIDRNPVQVDALNRDGLRISNGGSERTVKVKAALDVNGIEPVDLVIVLVKSFHTSEAVTAAAPIIGRRTVVMSLQNGLGQEDILVDLLGRDRVIAGKTYAGGVLLEPGRVLAGTRGKPTYIGELDGRISARVEAIAAEFCRAGIETSVSSNIVGTIWDKLLINVATGALSAITGVPYGILYATPEIKACALAAVAEAMAVAAASNAAVSVKTPEEAWDKAGVGLPANFKPSMLQSVEAAQKTEIDFINGAVVRYGERCNVPTPVNRTLVACVKGIERGILNAAAQT